MVIIWPTIVPIVRNTSQYYELVTCNPFGRMIFAHVLSARLRLTVPPSEAAVEYACLLSILVFVSTLPSDLQDIQFIVHSEDIELLEISAAVERCSGRYLPLKAVGHMKH